MKERKKERNDNRQRIIERNIGVRWDRKRKKEKLQRRVEGKLTESRIIEKKIIDGIITEKKKEKGSNKMEGKLIEQKKERYKVERIEGKLLSRIEKKKERKGKDCIKKQKVN